MTQKAENLVTIHLKDVNNEKDSYRERMANLDYSDGDIFIIDNMKHLNGTEAVRVDLCIILLCVHGHMQTCINGRNCDVRQGNILMVPPNVILSDQMFSYDFECKMLCLTDAIMQNILRSNLNLWNNALYIEKVNLLSIAEAQATNLNHLYEVLRFFLNEQNMPYRKEKIQNLISVMLLSLCSMLLNKIPTPPHGEFSHKENIFRTFLQNLSEQKIKRRTVDFYSEKLHITPKYLSLICKQISGKTAMEWIEEYVLEDVRYYLRNTEYSIREVALMLGFPNISFFGKYIKHHTNLAPKQYRKHLREN